jgi:hypothetical protein
MLKNLNRIIFCITFVPIFYLYLKFKKIKDMTSNGRIKVFEIMHFIRAMVIILGASLFIESCNKNEIENKNEERNSENEEVQYVPNRISVQQLLAIAVDRSFENNFQQQPSTKGSVRDINKYRTVAETNEPILHISYPFDSIQINKVVKFSCEGVKSPIVEAICGDGEFEVFIASFFLFINTETEEKEEVVEVKSSNINGDILRNVMIGEPMIVFKSELGIYSCIGNSGGVIDMTDYSAGFYTEFSSHKYLSDKALEKDGSYPVFQFIVTSTKDGSVTLKTTSIEPALTVLADAIPLSNMQTVNAQEIFNLVKLSNIPEASFQCEITGLYENYFTVKTDEDSNIETVCYDEYTKFYIGDRNATYTDIAEGDIITVTYGKLYKNYNPKSVIANKIISNNSVIN